MTRSIILYLIAILMCLIKFSDTRNTTTKRDSEVKIRYANMNSAVDPCLYSKCIHKCCPFGQYAKGKRCTDYDGMLDFSGISVYSQDIENTGKSVLEVFNISPGKFEKDSKFKNHSINMNAFGFNAFIIETGILKLEMPNVYNRWTTIQNGNYCVDYILKKGDPPSVKLAFWAIMEQSGVAVSGSYLTFASLVSCFFMLLVLLVYSLLPELQNLGGMILMAYVGSLFIAFLLLATIQISVYSIGICVGLSLGVYYFFLSSFCWMSVMSYDIWWTFRGYAKARPIHRRGERFKFAMYCLCAYGIPLIMTIGLGVLNKVGMKSVPWFITPHIPQMGCFIDDGAKMVYLYTPMLILIICNWMFFLMTAFNIWRLNRGTAMLDSSSSGTPAAHRNQRHRFMVYLKLSIVMGLNWLLEIVSFVYPGFKMWYISDTYNILIGLAIFLIFVCKKKIYRKLYKRYALKKNTRFYPSSAKSYSNSDSNSETTTVQVCADPKGLNGNLVPLKSM